MIKNNNYINHNILKKIQENLSNLKCKSFIIAEEDLYHHMNNIKADEKSFVDMSNLKYYPNDTYEIEYEGILDSIPVLKMIQEHENMILFTHFKGHPQIGFSGALKNLVTCSIGLNGQKKLHKLSKPFISKIACLACNVCTNECYEHAIIVDHVAHINQELCYGCNVCIETCPNNAIK